MVTSAASNSQLAAVLAGFVFSGIVILVARRDARATQTLGLFCACFVVLGFDSYLFSLVTGGQPDPYCVRVWSEGMIASGMLAVGAGGLICALCWLLADHVDARSQHGQDLDRSVHLDRLANLMVQGATAGIALLLGTTTRDFVAIAYDNDPSGWLIWTVAIGAPIAVILTTVIARGLYRGRHSRLRQSQSTGQVPVSLSVATYGSIIYGLIGPVLAGVLTTLPDRAWTNPARGVVAIVVVAALGAPSGLLVAIGLSAPRSLAVSDLSIRDAQPSTHVRSEGAEEHE